jgi:hypothetical protein
MSLFNYLIIYKNSSAIFTNYDLLSGLDIKLTLWRYLIEAASACISLHRYYSKTIPGI